MNYRKLWIGLFVIIIFLQIAYVAAFKTQTMLKFLDLNGEVNLPAWATNAMLAIAGFLALLNHLVRKRNSYFWLVLSIACFFISLDEIVQIHEQLARATGVKWVIFYIPVGIVVLIYLSRQALRLRDQQPHIITVMQGVFIGFILATGLESIVHFVGLPSTLQKIEYMVEEGAEMLGAGMILIGSLQTLIPEKQNAGKPN